MSEGRLQRTREAYQPPVEEKPWIFCPTCGRGTLFMSTNGRCTECGTKKEEARG